jgi:hypothetical protein
LDQVRIFWVCYSIWILKNLAIFTTDAPDTVFAGYPAGRMSGWPDVRLIQKLYTGYPAGYPVRAGYRISGRILDLTTIFLAKYQVPVNFLKAASTITNF